MSIAPPKRAAQTTMPTPPPNQASANKVVFSKPDMKRGHRVVLYGTGGVGKTTLACLAPGKVAVIDLDESLSTLAHSLDEQPFVVDAKDWKQVRSVLQSDGWDQVKTIVIDTATKLEEFAVAHTIATVKHEKGHNVSSVEDYGYGKGFQFVFDTFLPVLADLDRHIRAGRNVVLIAHECTQNVPNPRGEDWLRYEPRLQSPSSGKASIRHRIKEWADHVCFLGYDVEVNKDGKGQGAGTRTLYLSELPHCMAKSRTFSGTIDIEHGANPWGIFIK